MAQLTDRINRMAIQASSPNGFISAHLHGRTDVQLTFVAGYYNHASERELEWQLAGLGKLIWASRMREYYRILSDEFRQPMVLDGRIESEQDAEFVQQRDDLLAEGGSSDGRVRLTTRGMREWTVRIADGTVRSLQEYEFAQRVSEAAEHLILDQQDKIREIKVQIYDPELVSDYSVDKYHDAR